MEAGDLKAGHLLWTSSGQYLPVEKICLRSGPFVVYNFEVADAHDYFVSGQQVLVHNAPCPPTISQIKEGVRKAHELVGKQPKGAKKFPWQKGYHGTPKKGYSLEPPHPSHPNSGWHMNVWDYTAGKRGKGGYRIDIDL